LEKVVTSPTYDPTSRPVTPDVEQPDPRLGETAQQPDTGSTSAVKTAKSEAANVKDTAAGAASDVAQTAKSEASNVVQEAKYQARNLMDQTRSEVRGQVNNQQSAIAEKLNGWASQLGSMASKSDESGPMTDLAQEASRRVGEISHWLDNHEPGDVLEEVKRFARRRPATFLAIAAAAGVVAGRVTRGAVAANTSVDSGRESTPARAYDSDVYRGDYEGAGYGDRTYQDSGYTPRYGESVPTGAPYQGAGTTASDQPGATGTAYPNMTSAGDEAYYSPPVEGDVRR
jgi:vacuolar-type H+-ATPase subunit H